MHQSARDYIDKVLKDWVPGFAEADAAHAPLSRINAAFDQGRRDVLRGGSDTMTPAELTHLRANTSPVENTMRKLGLRTELVRSLGNDITNPVSHIDRILNRDWNSEKVAGQIGLPKSDALRRSLDAEHTFTATSNLDEASRGSRTNVLDSAQRRWGTNGAQGTNADAVAAFAGGTAVGVPATGAAAGAGV